MGVVGLVLLLSCANLSGLLLARAAARQREISIRLAIGAGGGRLMRQFLTESLALAAIGGVAGLAMARWFCMVLVTMMARGETTLTLATAADWRVLAFTAGISLAACVVAGLAPGWHALRVSLNPGLKQARAGANQRLGRMLVTSQLAISMVLVVGAALFTGTLVKLYSLDPGVRTDGVIVVRLRTNQRHTPARQWASIGALLERMNTLPGVASASAVSVLPIAGNLWDRRVQVEGYPAGGNENETSAFNVIAPRYFATVGTPFAAGRDFDGHDTAASPKVAIVNESFARHFFGERSPLGRRVTSVNVTYEIVGVVKDARYQGLRQDILKTMYIPWTQREGDPPANYYFLARLNAGNPMVLAAPIGNLAHDADPGLFLRTAEPYSAIVDRSITTERIMGLLGGFFGTLAIVVACVGLFGAMAFQVSRRVNEIGLRMALGASRSGIVALVLREVAMMFAPGAAVGAAGALALSGLTRKMLYGISPTEPAVFAVAGGILGLAAFAAGWLPARRASRIDPMTALRHE
jgi:predicted permease